MNPFGWQFNVKSTMNLNTVISHIPAVLSTYWLFVLDYVSSFLGAWNKDMTWNGSSYILKHYHNLHSPQKLCFILLIGGNCFASLVRQWHNVCFSSVRMRYSVWFSMVTYPIIEGEIGSLGLWWEVWIVKCFFVQRFSDNFHYASDVDSANWFSKLLTL